MPITSGSRLGSYEIVALIGAGGMGEVYRARDPRIGRDVAIKILPSSFSADADRLRRFESEARTAGMLNHPNLLTIFELGVHDGSPFLVSEILDGATLRDLASSALPVRKSIDYATQIAAGLAAAHEKGIVHRDLKPENIFITADDRVKLLDFGLAKLVAGNDGGEDGSRTLMQGTSPGMVVGTTAYMSPEQTRAEPVDQRSDIFSFGTVLYEMITGIQPFRRDSSAETMSAILREEPPAMTVRAVPPALERIVRHALEKSPSRRFQSARDIIFALEMLSGSGESAASSKPRRKAAEKIQSTTAYRRITFRRGFVMSARFAPDGSILYGASWEDGTHEIYASRPGSPESRPIGLPGADVLDVAPTGEMAVSLGRHFVAGWMTSGTLARLPYIGGAPREICEHVQDAMWSPDAKAFLICRRAGDSFRIEYPIGNVIYKTFRWISKPRLSPKGDRIAFLEHRIWGDDGGELVVIDLAGEERLRSGSFWNSTSGLLWMPKGDEVLVAAEYAGTTRDIIAVSMSGKERLILPAPGRFTLHDLDSKGSLLISFENGRREMIAGTKHDLREKNLSWFDWSFITGIARDGRRILFEEHSAGKGRDYLLYVRSADGGPAIHLGEGLVRGLSPDGTHVVIRTGSPHRLEMIPVGAGEARVISTPGIENFWWWEFAGDDKTLIVLGSEASHANRFYVVSVDGAFAPKAISPEGDFSLFVVSNDGNVVATSTSDQQVVLFDRNGTGRMLPGGRPGDRPAGWSADSRALYVCGSGRLSVDIDRIDITTGERTLWHTIRANDPAGIMDIQPVRVSSDEKTYVYGYRRFLSDLIVATGVF